MMLQPAIELAKAVRAGEVSARELLDEALERVERLNPVVNAVVTLDEERARKAAAGLDDRAARREFAGPLHGLPITVKDAIETEGLRSTGGAVELADHVPSADAPAVAALRRAGAVVFGKTNLPRWSADQQTHNDLFGVTANPWDTTRTPGGSSGGAAAAVACGMTAFELGTDIGGSVRMPAHCCGVFGLKPSYGVVPQRGYLDHVGGGLVDADLNVFGPLARSAADLDLVLGVVAGPVPEHVGAWSLSLPEGAAGRAGLAGVRVAAVLDHPYCPIERECLGLLRAAVDRMAAEGAQVEDAELPVSFAEQTSLYYELVMAATAPSLGDDGKAVAGGHLRWLRNQDRRATILGAWRAWFERYDVLVCPVWPTTALALQPYGSPTSRSMVVDGVERSQIDGFPWVGLANLVGLPAVSVPVGSTSAGLPVGLQVVAPYLHDRTAVRVAGLVGEACGGYRPPPLATEDGVSRRAR